VLSIFGMTRLLIAKAITSLE